VTIFGNEQAQTDINLPNNNLDIIIRDNDKGTRMLVDAAITEERNAMEKEAENIPRYKCLTMETQRRWNIK
jgi:hypothetical protein